MILSDVRKMKTSELAYEVRILLKSKHTLARVDWMRIDECLEEIERRAISAELLGEL